MPTDVKLLLEVAALLLTELASLDAMNTIAQNCVLGRNATTDAMSNSAITSWWAFVIAHNCIFVLIMEVIRRELRVGRTRDFPSLAAWSAFCMVYGLHLVPQFVATILVVHGDSRILPMEVLRELLGG